MNNNVISRRPVGPVRQHSLQQPPRRQQQIRRQRSTEDDKNLHLYTTKQSVTHNRFTDRPKVRVAWSDLSDKSDNDGVEIVARQIQTTKSGRLTGSGGGGTRRCPVGEKATILYSRQELAERLRLAWKQREENKANIDIFLAHNTVEDRSESRLSTETNFTSASVPIDKIQSQENYSKKEELKSEQLPKLTGRKFQSWFASFDSNDISANCQVQDDTEKGNEDRKEYKEKKQEQEQEKEQEERKKEDEIPSAIDEQKEDHIVIEKKSSISINCNEWNTSVTLNDATEINNDNKDKISSPKEPDYSLAKLKRASYQSRMNKAFVGPIIEKSNTSRILSRTNSTQELPRFRRTSSAPPQRRTQVNIVIDAPIMSPKSVEVEQNQPVLKTTFNRPIKSASQAKKRSKSSKRRGLSFTKDGDGETEEKLKGMNKSKNGLENKLTDVVTMVSLVSSADSESEMDENSARDDKLICELRNKLPTTPIIKSSNGLSGGIRKSFKSVSFQQDSFDYEVPSRPQSRPDDTPFLTAATLTMTSWRSEATLPIPEPLPRLPSNSEEATTAIETPLTDREKRCLAVPIGDVLDKKRKLFRCRSAVISSRNSNTEKPSSDTNETCLQTEMRMRSQTSILLQENNVSKIIANTIAPMSEPVEDKRKNLPAEPYCQTAKEKECWHLYRRMCDKGVFVSFDTVLRGMLTPTEYRLRQKEMSQNC